MNPIEIGTRRELFWDNYLIDTSRTTATLRQHAPQIQDLVLRHDAPWEGDGCNSYSIIRDGDLYRLYYLAWQMLNDEVTNHSASNTKVCYAESTDGIHWQKPDLHICQYDGSGANNIILDESNSDRTDMMYFFIDENPDCPPAEKYKAVGMDRQDYLACYISSDGLHFQKGWPMTNMGKFDTQNIAMWVPEQKQYLAYIRDFHDVPEIGGKKIWNLGVRDVRWMTSPDFRHWSIPQPLDFGNKEDYALYCNAIFLYPRAPHLFIGLPSRYVERKAWTENYDQLAGSQLRRKIINVHPRYGLTTTDCVLMTSRDGKSWDRWDEALIRPGIERVNNWVYGDCYPIPYLMETASALADAPMEYSLYCYENHWRMIPAQLRRYTIRQDGFVSYYAPYGQHQVITRPIKFAGSRMELNFSTSARGYVYVKIHCGSQTISSCELFGDALDRIVPFDGDIAELAGKEVTLEFSMRDADLFSFRFFA